MNSKTARRLIDLIADYFNSISPGSFELGVPFLMSDSLRILGYTGLIHIKGNPSGSIYFSASEAVMRLMAENILGAGEPVNEEVFTDLAGEVANTISGNAQRVFGEDYDISIPEILTENAEAKVKAALHAPVYVFPIHYADQDAVFVMGIGDSSFEPA